MIGYKKSIPYNIRGKHRPSDPSVLPCYALMSLHTSFILFKPSLSLCCCCLFLSLHCSVIDSSSHRDTDWRAGVCLCVCVCASVLSSHMLGVCPWWCVFARPVRYISVCPCVQTGTVCPLLGGVSVSGQPCDITLKQTIRTCRPTDVLHIEGRGLGCHGDWC